VDLAGLEPTASALQVRCSPELSYRPRVPPPWLAGGYSITPGRRQLVRASDADRIHTNVTASPRARKKRARIGAQQIESNESSPCLRNSEDANNVGASVPPLRAGHGEMKARVDCGYADPPRVSALLCRCSRAEHRTGARWWKKESNLHVPHGSHLIAVRVWSDYSRHPWRSRASARTARRRGNRTVSASPPGIARSTDTTIRRRDAGQRLADRDSYAIGWATGEPLGFLEL
jgi:hypothetical protein